MIGSNIWIVAVDGEQGCGKTTFIEDIKNGKYSNELKKFKLHFLKETTSELANDMDWIAYKLNNTMSQLYSESYSKQLISLYKFSVLRNEMINEIHKIKKEVEYSEDNHLIFIDRYWLTTAMYQSSSFDNSDKNPFAEEQILKLQYELFEDYIPDFQIVIGLPLEVTMKNRQERCSKECDCVYYGYDELYCWWQKYGVRHNRETNEYTEYFEGNIKLKEINEKFNNYLKIPSYRVKVWKKLYHVNLPTNILLTSDKNITEEQYKRALLKIVRKVKKDLYY